MLRVAFFLVEVFLADFVLLDTFFLSGVLLRIFFEMFTIFDASISESSSESISFGGFDLDLFLLLLLVFLLDVLGFGVALSSANCDRLVALVLRRALLVAVVAVDAVDDVFFFIRGSAAFTFCRFIVFDFSINTLYFLSYFVLFDT